MVAIIILSSQATKTMCATLFLEKVPKNVKCFTLELPNELTIDREQIEHCEATRMAMYIIAGAIVAFATIIIIYCIYKLITFDFYQFFAMIFSMCLIVL